MPIEKLDEEYIRKYDSPSRINFCMDKINELIDAFNLEKDFISQQFHAVRKRVKDLENSFNTREQDKSEQMARFVDTMTEHRERIEKLEKTNVAQPKDEELEMHTCPLLNILKMLSCPFQCIRTYDEKDSNSNRTNCTCR